MSSAVVMTRLFAWKPRWAVIRFVNSWARSTFDISTAPVVREPKPWAASPGVETSGAPELFDAVKRLPPSRVSPWSFGNFARVMYVVVVVGVVAGATGGASPAAGPLGGVPAQGASDGVLFFYTQAGGGGVGQPAAPEDTPGRARGPLAA